jgi:hypothetical protein
MKARKKEIEKTMMFSRMAMVRSGFGSKIEVIGI